MYQLREYVTSTLDLMVITSQLLELSVQKPVGLQNIILKRILQLW